MLIFIVPVFEKMFADLDGELPLPTQFLVVLSKNMVWIAPRARSWASSSFAVWWRCNKHTEQRARASSIRSSSGCRCSGRSCARSPSRDSPATSRTMTGSGVPILQALDIVGETSGNWVVEQALQKVQDVGAQGKSIAGPLARGAGVPVDGRADDLGR